MENSMDYTEELGQKKIKKFVAYTETGQKRNVCLASDVIKLEKTLDVAIHNFAFILHSCHDGFFSAADYDKVLGFLAEVTESTQQEIKDIVHD
jgi:hypothetical protein